MAPAGPRWGLNRQRAGRLLDFKKFLPRMLTYSGQDVYLETNYICKQTNKEGCCDLIDFDPPSHDAYIVSENIFHRQQSLKISKLIVFNMLHRGLICYQ